MPFKIYFPYSVPAGRNTASHTQLFTPMEIAKLQLSSTAFREGIRTPLRATQCSWLFSSWLAPHSQSQLQYLERSTAWENLLISWGTPQETRTSDCGDRFRTLAS